jgi:hypothetical protein
MQINERNVHGMIIRIQVFRIRDGAVSEQGYPRIYLGR